MSTLLRTLVVEDQVDDFQRLIHELRGAGFDPTDPCVASPEEFLAHLDAELDIVFAAFTLTGFNGLDALRLMKERKIDVPFVFVSGTPGEEAAVTAMQEGAADYLLKDRLARLGPAVKKILAQGRLKEEKKSERGQSESALRRSEERYRTLAAATAAIVWDTLASGEFASDQPRWTEFTGQTVDQHRGWGWLNAIHPRDREVTARTWATAVRHGSPYHVEHRLRRWDGEYRQMSVRAFPIFEPDGAIREWVGVHTDVTEQRRSEYQRDELLTQLTVQINRMPLGYLLSGPDFRYTRWNPAAERMFGFSEAEVLGKHPFETIVPPQSEALLADIFSRLAEGDMQAHGTCENVTKGGATIVCEWHNTPLFGPNGSFQGLLSLTQDVTARQNLEEQLRQAQKMDAFGQLAGGVAHDFNNLLTIINGYSQILLQKLPEDNQSRPFVEEINKAGERSAALTRQLLAFSRKQILAMRTLNLNEVVAETDMMLRRLIGEDVRLTTTLASRPWPVRADSGQLAQVLLNLAVNARDAMPTGGRLTIETQNVDLDETYMRAHPGAHVGPHVLLRVTDTGCGISPDVIARIFEPFFTTKGPFKGTGLGLATVYGIVTQCGGHVTVESEVGVGTTFNVYLPRVKEPAEGSHNGSRRPIPRGTETILLAEDEAGVRAMTSYTLSGCGYQVLEAADGEEALRVADAHNGPIHLLITDVVMPGMGGRTVAERMASRHPQVRVLFISGYTEDAVIRHGVLREEMNFLPKPFSPVAMAFKVREVLDAPAENGRC